METDNLIAQLYRTEYRKIASVLCRHFGLEEMELAEDIASDTFLKAAVNWAEKGIPQNPMAWLYHVAKNDARNVLQRRSRLRTAPAGTEPSASPEPELDLSPQNINDSQLQMMFAICHPSIPPEAQVGLSLRILCGFGIEEIARAFLTSKDTINKRLFRARERLREGKVTLAMPHPSEIEARLETVLTTIYLLFNEGYYSESQDSVLRKDLCLEAMRLCNMLVENPETNKPEVNALLSLMCFHASRFDARLDRNGELILYEEQDTSLWNADLISRGGYFLECSTRGRTLSRYHVEAAIAFWNTQKTDAAEKWEQILQLYNRLLTIAYSPVAALNRTYALARANGKQEAIEAAERLDLRDNHYYFALLGELYSGIDDAMARQHFDNALALARTHADKQIIRKKLARLAY